MALGTEMIDLLRFYVIDDIGELFSVGEVTVMKKEADIVTMGILIDMINSVGIEGGRAPDYSMYFIPLMQQ